MANNNIKLFIILLLICYIIVIIYLYIHRNYQNKEDFIGILDILTQYNDSLKMESLQNVNSILTDESANEPISEQKVNSNLYSKPATRYIYISETNDPSKYRFYDKNFNNYANLYIDQKNIKLYDINNNIIGKLINEIYNKFTLNIDYYNKNNIHIEFYNNFKELKLYIDDDDKYFYVKSIKSINDIYTIFLFNKNIGKIYYDNSNYKIIVYEDYRNYLNLFGIGFILFLKN